MEYVYATSRVILCMCLFLGEGTSVFSEEGRQSPSFDVPVVNVTQKTGQTAILPCTINGIGLHKIVWMGPRTKILTLGDSRVIHDTRVSVERPYKKDWNLHIRKVRMNDSGEYECQINTDPVKSKTISLFVHEPPSILEHAGNIETEEGKKVNLWCKVTGTPYPRVTWFRKYVHENHKAKEVLGSDGEALIIYNISRYCDDVYECVANNEIEPAAKQEMKVSVQFAPEISLPTNRIGQSKDRETILDCRITMNPHALIVWKKGGKEISNSLKYGLSIYEEDLNTKTLSLRVGHLNDNDFGKYKCFAQNELGTDEQEMTLYELVDRKLETTTTTTMRPYVVRHPNNKQPPYNGNVYYQNTNNQHPTRTRTSRPSYENAVAALGQSPRLHSTYNNAIVTVVLTVLSFVVRTFTDETDR